MAKYGIMMRHHGAVTINVIIFVLMEQHTDKELELLIVKQLENLIQQQEAIQAIESQQDLINSAITQQKDLNIISDSVIEDLEKSNKELKANTSTPTIDYNKIEDIVKENTATQDEIKIADRLYYNILNKEDTPTPTPKSTKISAKDIVKKQIIKDSFKAKRDS